jgi:hypothetical protein
MDNNIVNSDIPESSRHQRKCCVCRHPARDAIEEAFIHWHSPNQIAIEHELEEASIYRHAHATGLFDRRQRNLRFALENYIERVNEIQIVTPEALVRAIQAYTRLSKTGEWIEPPRQITVTHVNAADVPTHEPDSEPDIMQIIAPERHLSRLPRTRSRGAGNGRARERKAES